MFITLGLLILFVISYIVDFRQYKNVFLLGMFLISLFSSIVVGLLIPFLNLHMNINYLLMTNIIYGLIVIVVMLLSLLNLKKKIANEGRFVTNMIVLGYGTFIFLNFMIILFKPHLFVDYFNGLIVIVISFFFYYLNLIFILHNLYSWILSGVAKRKKSDFIIVLGAGIIGEKVTPLLKARLDKAIKLKKKSLDTLIIVSGGQGPDEKISEAEAMRRYLVDQGIRNEDIIMEDKSTNTEENLVFSNKIMDKYKSEAIATIVSNHFHILRAAFLSKKLNMNATVTGGSSKSYFYPNAYIREYLAILYMYKKTHIIAIIVMLALVISYTLLAG
ncbi:MULTISPECIES: YdcF family protein [Mammaliicoccus]|uniref:YdcF family protein n=2 Tax=Mammaliicoccus fleurettii TaxID=150056 RepID=A0ABS5MJC4_9STAP|nr:MULTISPECIES: YdcF family protein [Mammaliicoccus]MBL0846500.1 YdcF family protein [Mammaliicoccus fleurettii]MBO3062914.1 YdcF family protein [Mammaliicoccus fleurettii]MBS3670941.1 YdcF family protein [Mammaliicoccus fleurettii]MBS3696000.1 YdcF family protein [Mammaliicoccus fleurettii]MBW0764445.1 YdcF family protein [Mammaliicoccus fleurettii]